MYLKYMYFNYLYFNNTPTLLMCCAPVRIFLTAPSLQSSEMHIEARQSLESIGRAQEVSFEFRAKYSLGEGIGDMRG